MVIRIDGGVKGGGCGVEEDYIDREGGGGDGGGCQGKGSDGSDDFECSAGVCRSKGEGGGECCKGCCPVKLPTRIQFVACMKWNGVNT